MMKKVKSSALAIAMFGVALAAPVAHSGESHEKAYYAHHLDEAEKRSIWCNHVMLTRGVLSTSEIADCKAAEKAVHERNFPEYVPGKGKAWSSAGGTN
ncbi:hypothetical protein IAG25_33110 [Caballeronia sp. EK]|uniref:hypothetical protein n=1 Tax=Caballeronia sp. EK TaxID=2767469 RepID=UPI00165606FD|nr:hypothetical protein [Caballeronia sp. EK]MBC8641667.1 hypothetical protein [Caballeronia sp. EK]